jgi:hypothetical protein
LKSSDASAGAKFGAVLAINRYGLAVASSETDAATLSAGVVHLYERGANGYEEAARLPNPQSAGGNSIGNSLTIGEGVLAAAGLDVTSQSALPSFGAVYLFERSASGWSYTTRFESLYHGAFGDGFANSVQLAGGTLFVAAPYDSSDGAGIGADYANQNLPFSGAIWIIE